MAAIPVRQRDSPAVIFRNGRAGAAKGIPGRGEKEGAMTDPVPAQKAPYEVTLEEGKRYLWCACGRSLTQPFCDGSHKVTDLRPVAFKPEKSGRVWLCGCKATGNRPFCDGTHSTL